MAGHFQTSRPNTPSLPLDHPPSSYHTSDRALRPSSSSSRRPVPQGACNYRNLDTGAKAPSCGCRRFWVDDLAGEQPLNTATNSERRSRSQANWCICGHHACYHDYAEPGRANARATAQSPPLLGSAGPGQQASNPIYLQLVPGKSGGYLQLLPRAVESANPSQTTTATTTTTTKSSSPSNEQSQSRAKATSAPSASSVLGQEQQFSDDVAVPATNVEVGQDTAAVVTATAPVPVTASVMATAMSSGPVNSVDTSDLPRIPSACLMDSDERNFVENMNHGESDIRPTSGLGLKFQHGNETDLMDKDAPVPDACIDSFDHARIESQNLSGSAEDSRRRISPSRAFMDYINPDAYMSREIPYNLPIQTELSVTEVATPSNSNTPDLRALDNNISAARTLVEGLWALNASNKLNEEVEKPSADKQQFSNRHAPQLLLTDSSQDLQNPLASILGSLSPGNLQKLSPYLGSLHHILTAFPNLSTAMGGITARLDALENRSLSHIQPDEVDYKFEMFDGRVLELEQWKDDHDRLHAAIDADHSSREGALIKRVMTENGSFGSDQSLQSKISGQSGTSSAVIVASAIDRREIDGIKERLDDLESAVPSSANPWHIEVVLLPWGRDLRGIWFSPDQGPTQSSRMTTQDTEEWTQVRGVKSSSPGSMTMHDVGHSGWSSQAIHQWADTTDEWLSPKGCGSKNLAYKRLRSRGFVRTVTISSPNAGDIQAAISMAFTGLSSHMARVSGYAHSIDLADEDRGITRFPGLVASFIPLRKIYRSSRLRFLAPSELATSALWTSQFLSSGIMMRLPGGSRRLYVTHREAYLQRGGQAAFEWSWPLLRELPRMVPSQDSQQSRNGAAAAARVAEADAKESCWEYHPSLDVHASAGSSFSSHDNIEQLASVSGSGHLPSSGQLSFRPASEHRESEQPSPPDIQPRVYQPISPLSEMPTRPLLKTRTSLPSTDEGIFVAAPQQLHHTKRRVASFDGPARSTRSNSSSKAKRRRLTRSPDAQISSRGWGYTPRRSKEPSSPFFSEARAPSDGRSEVLAPIMVGSALIRNKKGGHTPSAYATPHSGTGAVDIFFPGGDTERDSDSDESENDKGDGESWHGLVGDDDDAEGGGGGGGGGFLPDVGTGAIESGDEDELMGSDDNDALEQEEDSDEDDEDYEEGVDDEGSRGD